VVLSGYGHDGATGATAIHALGGTVIAATSASSTVASVPDATAHRDHIADHVVTIEGIAPLLIDLVTQADPDR
jgi:two-component system chemotaxis response regulator CheB